MRTPIVGLLCLAATGCTSMPSSYTNGDPEIWPRWGYRVTNETAEHIDLEVIVMEFAFMCTAADGQMERACDIWNQCAAAEAGKRKLRFEPSSTAEINCTHTRNVFDAVCTVRAGKRMQIFRSTASARTSPPGAPTPP